MVGPLKHYKKDPQGKGRGEGEYYKRRKGQYSKYDTTRDLDKDSPIRQMGRTPLRYPHIADTRIVKRLRKILGKI